MKKLYGYWGGSRLHDFPTTDNSDWDYYSVGISSHVTPYKIYPNVKIHQKKRTPNLDVEKVELCCYFTYLMNGFLFQVESLFVPKNWMDYLDPKFESLVLNQKHLLIDRTQLIENVGSNIESVRRKTVSDIELLANRVLTGNPPQKIARGVTRMRDEYRAKGYYHKDYLHNIRIAASLLYFLKNDVYPLATLRTSDPAAYKICCEIKAHPDRYTRADLDGVLNTYLHDIDKVNIENDEEKFRFDAGHALGVLKEFDILGKT
jgi:hypothetical protein